MYAFDDALTFFSLHNVSDHIIVTVILTQTVGQVTDAIAMCDFGTQTAQPKTNLSFARFLQKEGLKVPEPLVTIDDIITKNATILQAQIEEIQKIDEKLNAISTGNAPSAVAGHSNDVPSIVIHEENDQMPEYVAKCDSKVDDNIDEPHHPMASATTTSVDARSLRNPPALKRQQKLSIQTVSRFVFVNLISNYPHRCFNV